MSKYFTIREKLPQEGEVVLICAVTGGVYRMHFVGGKFVREDDEFGDCVIDPKNVLKWKYPEN